MPGLAGQHVNLTLHITLIMSVESSLRLTMDVMFDPGEGDGTLSAALTEPEQEGTGTLITQQSLLPLLTDEAQDGAAHRQKKKHSQFQTFQKC